MGKTRNAFRKGFEGTKKAATDIGREMIAEEGSERARGKGRGSGESFLGPVFRFFREKNEELKEKQRNSAKLWRFIHGSLKREHPDAAEALLLRKIARQSEAEHTYDDETYTRLDEDRMSEALVLFTEDCSREEKIEILTDLANLSDEEFDAMIEAVLKEPISSMMVKITSSMEHVSSLGGARMKSALQYIRDNGPDVARKMDQQAGSSVESFNSWLRNQRWTTRG